MNPLSVVFLTPLHNTIIISAFVQCVELGPERIPLSNPSVRDDANIGVAGKLLPEHFNTMVWMENESIFSSDGGSSETDQHEYEATLGGR